MSAEVTDFLAFLLVQGDGDRHYIFRNSYSDCFWVSAVERKVKSLMT